MTSWLDAVERTVTGLGYELVDADRSAGGLLRVTIDRPPAVPSAVQAFIQVDDCERVTRQLQYVLEVENCAYERLEVSSPGLDRPLKKSADYQRFVGELIEITLKEPFKGRKKYRGTLEGAGEAWRLLLAEAPLPKPLKKSVVKRPKEPAGEPEVPRQALDFSLDEVRDARLVPVLDFKGRRFGTAETETVAAAALPDGDLQDDEIDGGRIQ